MKKVFLGTLILLSFSFATATPEIVEPDIPELEHGDGAVISAEIIGAEEVTVDVYEDGEKIGVRPLHDYSNDNYYANQMLEGAEGYSNYKFEIKACDGLECNSEKFSKTTSCNLGLIDYCIA